MSRDAGERWGACELEAPPLRLELSFRMWHMGRAFAQLKTAMHVGRADCVLFERWNTIQNHKVALYCHG